MIKLLQTCYCEGNREKFHTTENMAKTVLPQHVADIETIVAEYLQKWEETSNKNTALVTDEKWGEASSDDTALTDEEREQAMASEGGLLASNDKTETRNGEVFRGKELDASDTDTALLTDENITVQDTQSPHLTRETSPQSVNETTGTTTQN